MSFAGFLAPAAWILLCFGGSAVTAAISGDERIFAIGFYLTLLGRIAGYHGYAFRSQTRTRAQGTLVTYVRYR
jgi:uncharacterized membrane protein YecN with MAPEG domain